MSSEEKWLREMFRERAGSVEATGDFTGPAVALAGRRRRRAAVAAVAAGVVAVAGVGVATWAVAGPEVPAPVPATRTTAPPSPSPSASSPSPSATASPTSTPTPSESSTPTPAPPSTPYALDGTVHLGDGTLDVAAGRVVTDLGLLDGGRVLVRVQRPGDRTSGRWQILDGDGGVVASLGAADIGLAGADGRTVVLQTVTAVGDVLAYDDGGRLLRSRSGTDVVPTAAVGGRVVLSGQAASSLWDVATGTTTSLPAGTRWLTPDGRHGMGTTGADPEDEQCWFLVDLSRGSTKTLERCGAQNPVDFEPHRLSADGRWILGATSTDGGFYEKLAVADARDGSVVVDHRSHGSAVNGWSAEFDGSADTFLFSRNASDPPDPALRNDLVRCTVELVCTSVGKGVALVDDGSGYTGPRYVVARPLAE